MSMSSPRCYFHEVSYPSTKSTILLLTEVVLANILEKIKGNFTLLSRSQGNAGTAYPFCLICLLQWLYKGKPNKIISNPIMLCPGLS